jgi:membrane protein implicated in regulation of membrane protease activity
VKGRDGAQRPARPDAGVVLRYAVLQIPGWLLAAVLLFWIDSELDVSTGVLWILGLAWVAKDVALFPLTWRAYAGSRVGDAHDPVGRVGISLERLAPHGRIRLQGETWRAVAEPGSVPIGPDVAVLVTGREGLELRVRPQGDGRPASPPAGDRRSREGAG